MEEQNEQIAVIESLQREIVGIYKKVELRGLAGVDFDFMVGERQVLAWFFDVVRKGQNKYRNVNFYEVFDDLVFCLDEALYQTALLYLYAPHMNNPIRDGHPFAGRTIYPNHQNLPAKRFSMHSNSAFEKVYNFWDRIGDLIAIYMPQIYTPNKKVYFGSVIDSIPEKYQNSEHFKWLKAFKDTAFTTMNSQRINIVHYLTNDTAFRHKHLQVTSDRVALELLIAERDRMPEYFKAHIQFALDGFVHTVQLLEEITAEELQDIP